jgi:hypothetical protein
MQDPPQQSMNDFGLPSQQLPITRLDIVVNFRRPWMIFLSIVFVGVLALLLALFWVLSHLIPIVFVIFSDGVLILYCLLFMSSIFRALFLHQPALIINSAGIQILTFHGAGRCFISWPEIDTISEDYYYSSRYLQIHPKNYKRYLSRLSAFKRFILWYATRWPNGPLMQVPLLYLDRPGVEIFQQLSQLYARELDYYRVCLQLALEE